MAKHMARDNGMFKGEVKTNIHNLYQDIKDIKIDIKELNNKIDILSIDVNTLKVKASTWGAIAGGITGFIFALLLKLI